MARGEIATGVIVLIALALLVLIIMAVLVARQVQNGESTVNNCKSVYQGTCMGANECANSHGSAISGTQCGGAATYSQPDNWVVYSYPAGGTVCCVTK